MKIKAKNIIRPVVEDILQVLKERGIVDDDEYQRLYRETTNYVHAMVSWLARRSEEEANVIWPEGRETVAGVYEMLRGPTARKRWLVACFWKKLLDTHVRRPGGGLSAEPERFAMPEGVLGA